MRIVIIDRESPSTSRRERVWVTFWADKIYGQLLRDDSSGFLFVGPRIFYISSLPFLWIVVGKTLSAWWFQRSFIFNFIYGNFIIPTDELIFFRGVGIPPTSYAFYTGNLTKVVALRPGLSAKG